MPYERPWYSQNPGCLIVLIDQSGSMSEPIQRDPLHRRKCDFAATIVNNMLSSLIEANATFESIKPRAEVAIIGYGGSGVRSAYGGALQNAEFATLPDLNANPVRTEERFQPAIDTTGKEYEQKVDFSIWVDAVSSGGTPMGEALHYARRLADKWVGNHPDSHPPVVINVTDGAATDCGPQHDFTPLARSVTEIETPDGSVLLLNCHITSDATPPILYPTSAEALPHGDRLAGMLFETASMLPNNIRNRMLAKGRTVEDGARGFVYNGDPISLAQMFSFVTPTRNEFSTDK